MTYLDYTPEQLRTAIAKHHRWLTSSVANLGMTDTHRRSVAAHMDTLTALLDRADYCDHVRDELDHGKAGMALVASGLRREAAAFRSQVVDALERMGAL